MKRFIVVILSVIYFVISVGGARYNVYCHNKLADSLVMSDNHDCSKCHHCVENSCPIGDTCCRLVQVELFQNHTNRSVELAPVQLAMLRELVVYCGYKDIVQSRSETYPITDVLPVKPEPIFILNCTYLI